MTSPTERAIELHALGVAASTCTACRLHESRTNVVFGSGDPDADLMIVGEGPGQTEDEQGLPFVGRSGELLDTLLGEIGLLRGAVYIANVVKCRPPRNRDPQQDEIDTCKGYLRRQLQLVDPLCVLTLGNFSSKLLMRTEVGITRLRGHVYPWWGRHLVATFHPAAALRGSVGVLADMRHDMALVRAVIDGNLPASVDEAAGGPMARVAVDDATAGAGAVTPPTVDDAGEPDMEQLDLFR